MGLFSRKPKDERTKVVALVELWRFFETVELDQPHLDRKLKDFALRLDREIASSLETIRKSGEAGSTTDVDFLFETLDQLPIPPAVKQRVLPDQRNFTWDRTEAELGVVARVVNGIRVPIQQHIRQSWQKNITALERRVAELEKAGKREELEKFRADLEATLQAERNELANVDKEFRGYLSSLYRLLELYDASLQALARVKTEEGLEMIRYTLQSEHQSYRNLAVRVLQIQNWQPPTVEAKLDFLIPQVKVQGTEGIATREIEKLIRGIGDATELINVVEPKLAEEGLTELQALLLEQLCSLHSEKALDRLAAVMTSSLEPPALKAKIAGSLAEVRSPRAVQLLISALDELDTEVRTVAAEALGRSVEMADPDLRKAAMERLVFALRDGDVTVRDASALALKAYPEAMTNLAEALLQDRNPNAREYAAKTLSRFTAAEASSKALLQALGDEDAAVRLAAALALEEQKQVPADLEARTRFLCARQNWKELARIGKPVIPCVARLLRDRNESIRLAAVTLLGTIRAREAVRELAISLSDSNQDVRREAARALRLINDPSVLDALRAALPKEGFKEVRAEIEQAIAKLELGAR